MDTVTLTIKRGKGYVSSIPSIEGLKEDLVRATSFKAAGHEHTVRYRRGHWDGRTKLFKHQKFPPGLVARITDVLDSYDIPWSVENHDQWETKTRLDIKLQGIEERDYQEAAIERCILLNRGIIQAPTGAGKTAIAAGIIQARGFHSVVIVPTIDLLYQFKRFLREHLVYSIGTKNVPLPGKIGQLGDGVVDPQPITVATLRSMARVMGVAYERYEFGEYDDRDETDINRRALREWVERIGTVVVDEGHILGAETVYETVTQIPAIAFYCMSASPWRDDGADLMIEAATGPKIYRIGTEELVKDGWLVPPIVRVVSTRGWWRPAAWGRVCKKCKRQVVSFRPECPCGSREFRSQFTDCYKHEIVENPVRNAMIAAEVQKLDRQTLVLVKQVKHGRLLQQMIEGSVFLSGRDSSDERNAAYEACRTGECKVLIATTIADMGLDIPSLGALALAGGGKSSTRHLQRMGRVARTFPGKKDAIILDFDDGHVHYWFRNHEQARRRIELAEWRDTAIWL